LIRSIVFDIGWVLVHLNPRPILDCLAEHQCDVRDLHGLVRRIGLAEHEAGRLTGRGLVERLAALGRHAWISPTPGGSTCSSCNRGWWISRIA
jgi:hypothetical protein